MVGRFQSLAFSIRISINEDDGGGHHAYHVISFKHLTLIASTIAVQRKGTGLLSLVFLSERYTSTDWHLSTNNTVPTKEGWCEYVHGSSFTIRHADLAAQQLANDSFNGPTTHDSVRMAPVCGDKTVVFGDSMLNTY